VVEDHETGAGGSLVQRPNVFSHARSPYSQLTYQP
jgi:hypothetical protein